MAYSFTPLGKQLALDEDEYVKVQYIDPLPILINRDGAVVRYDPSFIEPERADVVFNELRTYEGDAQNAEGWLYGKYFKSKRRTIQMADPGVRVYRFTGATADTPEPLSNYPAIAELREEIYERFGLYPNYCLYNAYTPDAGLGWHSDDEKDMVAGSTIISLSFGDTRRFRIRHKVTKEITDVYLSSGSLLTMERKCQKVMDHCVWDILEKEKDSIIHGLRINLTFRFMKTI